jgi:hypothetical protein
MVRVSIYLYMFTQVYYLLGQYSLSLPVDSFILYDSGCWLGLQVDRYDGGDKWQRYWSEK